MKNYDAIVIGGGMVGAATALGLAQIGLQVAIVERTPIPHFSPSLPYDIRISAISAGSVNLLKQLNVWGNIETMRVCPYKRLSTWEIDGCETTFSCDELNLTELGYMIENNVVQLGIWQAFYHYPNLECYVAATSQIERHNERWQVRLNNGGLLQTPLLIAADGASSKLRQLAHIGVTGWEYRQHCMLILVETEIEQQDITWQQFFPTGPRAFLPLLGNQGCLVWYDSSEKLQQLRQLTMDKLTQVIHTAFPTQLGTVKAVKTACFPLVRRHAQHYVKNGIVLIGDSAHTINPLAGQGVNLGFKDVAVFLDVIKNAQLKGENFACSNTLLRYQRHRKTDNLIMQTSMDLFYKGFKEDILLLKIARNLALLAIQGTSPLKKQALKYALGL